MAEACASRTHRRRGDPPHAGFEGRFGRPHAHAQGLSERTQRRRKFHAQGVGRNRAGTDCPRDGTSELGDFRRRRETRNEALYAAGTNAETRDSNYENGR